MQVGDFHEENIQFSQDQVILFGKTTGDYNPIHFDDDEAIEAKFKKDHTRFLIRFHIF